MDNKFLKKLEREIQKSDQLINKLISQRNSLNDQIKQETENKKSLESTRASVLKLYSQFNDIEEKFNNRNDKPAPAQKEKDDKNLSEDDTSEDMDMESYEQTDEYSEESDDTDESDDYEDSESREENYQYYNND